MKRDFYKFGLGIFLISLVTLAFQVTLSYEFAFMFWFNVSITVISIAMFGLGIGGVTGYFIAKFRPERYFQALFYSSAAFGISVLASIFLIARASTDFMQSNSADVAYFSVVSAFPFVFAGIVLSMGLRYPSPDKRVISYIYFADLIGAGIGSFALTALLPFTSLERIVLILALLPLVSSLLFKPVNRRELSALSSAAIILVVLFSLASASIIPQPSNDKFLHRLKQSNASVLDTRWTSVSRVDIVEYADKSRIRFIVNGNYPVTASTGNLERPGDEKDPRYIMFYKEPKTMVAIGSGGGVELTMGIFKKVEEITAVEINPFIIDYMKTSLSDYSRRIYFNPIIKTVIEDGRTYVHRTKDRFDLIENGVIGNNGLVVPSSTVLTFQDAYVYTVEADQDYFRHLSPDGVAVTIIYGLLDNYNALDADRGVTYYLLRQYNTVYEALKREGVEPEKHMVIMRFVQRAGNLQPATAQAEYTFIFKKPLTPEDVNKLIDEGREFNLEPLYAPYYGGSLDLEEISRTIPRDRAVFATSDDRPFFYHTEKPTPKILKKMLVLLGILTFAFILLPVMVDRRLRFENTAAPLLLIYFSGLGLGYILIEAVVIQKLTLFLGRPAYAFQVVLFSMLVFSGLGSYLTGRLIPSNNGILGKTRTILGVTTGVILIWSLILPRFIYGFMHYGIFLKVLLSVGFIAVIAILMGMPFPLGLRITSSLGKDDVIWMYGINSAGSVLGSLIGIMIAFKYGFSYSLFTGSAFYGLAFLVMALTGAVLKKTEL